MIKKALPYILLLTVILVVTSCSSPQGNIGGTQTSEALTSYPVSPSPGSETVITLDNNGNTLELAVGERFLLKLGLDYTWDLSVSDQSVFSRVPNIAVIVGAQGIYEAHKSGTATLTAVGYPVCRQSVPPCEAPSVQFILTVVVK